MNLAVCQHRFGVASEVAEVVELDDPPPPSADQVGIEILAAPIDPGHLLMFEGLYGLPQTTFPVYAGNQAAGVVVAVGSAVTEVRAGDRVLLGDGERGTWRQRLNVAAANVIVVPDVDPVQLSFVLSTLSTAFCLVTMQAPLQAGEWLLQNAANSAVGLQVVRLSRHLGAHCASIVRSEAGAQAVRAHGGDAVFLSDESDLRTALTQATGGRLPSHAFDALAGPAVGALARCLADGGVVTTYGALTRMPYTIDTASVLFRGIRLQGFWRTRWAATAPRDEVRDVYRRVAGLLADGVFEVPVEATYPIREIRQALEHAARPGRGGKIVLLPNRDA